MDKASELRELREFAHRLGPNSYVGPWIAEVREDVASFMLSDMPIPLLPSVTGREARERAEGIIRDAEKEAAAMLQDAIVEAKRIRTEADRRRMYVEAKIREIAKVSI